MSGNATVASPADSPLKLAYIPSSGAVLHAQAGRVTTIIGAYNNDMRAVLNELGADYAFRLGGCNVLNVPDELFRSPTQFWNDYNQYGELGTRAKTA